MAEEERGGGVVRFLRQRTWTGYLLSSSHSYTCLTAGCPQGREGAGRGGAEVPGGRGGAGVAAANRGGPGGRQAGEEVQTVSPPPVLRAAEPPAVRVEVPAELAAGLQHQNCSRPSYQYRHRPRTR